MILNKKVLFGHSQRPKRTFLFNCAGGCAGDGKIHDKVCSSDERIFLVVLRRYRKMVAL